MNKEKTRFELASEVDVNSKTEKKGNLTYLSWAWAWVEFKKIYPEATYLIKKFGENNLPYVYDDKTGYMVFTEVITEKETLEMWLPVMDFRNKAMKEDATMFDINKTIMRCLTKNLAMFGLGLYIYAGEDLPEADSQDNREAKPVVEKTKSQIIAGLCKDLGLTGSTKLDYELFVAGKTGKPLTEDNFDYIIEKLNLLTK